LADAVEDMNLVDRAEPPAHGLVGVQPDHDQRADCPYRDLDEHLFEPVVDRPCIDGAWSRQLVDPRRFRVARTISLRPIGPALVRPCLGGLLAGLILFGMWSLFEYPRAVELLAAGGAVLIVYLLLAIRPRQFSKLIASARRGEVQA
jgi:hypothetical protein